MQLLIDGSIEAAQTIISCSRHQKSIVNDMLTLSKMDLDLLSITPDTVDPRKVMRGSVEDIRS